MREWLERNRRKRLRPVLRSTLNSVMPGTNNISKSNGDWRNKPSSKNLSFSKSSINRSRKGKIKLSWSSRGRICSRSTRPRSRNRCRTTKNFGSNTPRLRMNRLGKSRNNTPTKRCSYRRSSRKRSGSSETWMCLTNTL